MPRDMSKTDHCAVVLDLELLREFVGDHPATLARFLSIGLQSLEQVLTPCLGVASVPLPQLREMAHRAKSTARQLGATDWAAACEALEWAARDGTTDAALAHWSTVRTAWPALRHALGVQIVAFQNQQAQ